MYSGASPLGLMFLNDIYEDVVFNDVVIGDYQRCHVCLVREDYRVEHGYGLRLFRNHMYRSFNITFRSFISFSYPRFMDRTRIQGIIVHNKRYSESDIAALRGAIEDLKHITVEYIDWSKMSIQDQLLLLRDTDLYISGPGTGIMYHPFLTDGSVLIALGHHDYFSYQSRFYNQIFLSKRQLERTVGFMEQMVTAGIDYIRALYYPICERHRGIRKDIVLDLVNRGVNIIRSNFSIPLRDYRVNLAPDGLVVDPA